jgi:hypothetical protein
MSPPRVAFITNLCPYYRRPLYELPAERLQITFYFFFLFRRRGVLPWPLDAAHVG